MLEAMEAILAQEVESVDNLFRKTNLVFKEVQSKQCSYTGIIELIKVL